MKNVLVPFRYFLFVAFIICNAITCSTAVWNLSLSQAAGRTLSVDGFVIFASAAALAFIFPTILIELAYRDPFSGRVWFECLWVAFFGVLEFCAAVVLSAIGPGVMCSARVMVFVVDSCTSTRVVLAFSWICTVLLLGYLLLLTLSAYMHKNENPQIWSCNVRRFDWGGSRTYVSNDGPKRLSLPRFVEKARPGSLVLPKPHQPLPKTSKTYPDPNHAVQHFQPQPLGVHPIPPIPAATSSVNQIKNNRDTTATSFYPRHMQSVMASQPSLFSKPMRELPRSSSPPPLGDWPRPSIISQPRAKRQEPLRPSNSTSPGPVRPQAPRRSARSASSSADWRKIPPPLDLSKISSHTRLDRL